MFNLFKSKSSSNPADNYFPLKIDMHSHLVPGIDDGASDVQASIELIEGLQKLGINQSIATPHIIGDLYRNTNDTIEAALKLLQAELDSRNNNFKIRAAAEYQLDDYFIQLLRDKVPLRTLKDNIILTEFSWLSRPEKVDEICFEILTEGYKPILAHPERYAYFHNEFKMYEDLKEKGFLLQLNLLSLTGHYGPAVAKVAKQLLKEGLISYIGTDLHHPQHLQALSDFKTRKTFYEHLQGHSFLNEELG